MIGNSMALSWTILVCLSFVLTRADVENGEVSMGVYQGQPSELTRFRRSIVVTPLGKRLTKNLVEQFGKRPREMYSFGIGKRSISMSELEEYLAEQERERQNHDQDKSGPVTHHQGRALKSSQPSSLSSKRDPYAFGLGKRDPYTFGLGKRSSELNSIYKKQDPYEFGLGKRDPYAFGLGKRSQDPSYAFGLGKKRQDYAFGLGKRDPYAFGLGKRDPYTFGLGRKRDPYAFGLGKRDPYAFGLGKRDPYGFGLGKRSSDDDMNEQ